MENLTKGWPRRTVKIPEYNWEIVFFDPTEGELLAIDEARTAVKNAKDDAAILAALAKVKGIVAGFIETWDCTDRKGNPLPVEGANFDKLPPKIKDALIAGITGPAEKSADPKADSASLPVTPLDEGPESAVKSPDAETPPA